MADAINSIPISYALIHTLYNLNGREITRDQVSRIARGEIQSLLEAICYISRLSYSDDGSLESATFINSLNKNSLTIGPCVPTESFGKVKNFSKYSRVIERAFDNRYGVVVILNIKKNISCSDILSLSMYPIRFMLDYNTFYRQDHF